MLAKNFATTPIKKKEYPVMKRRLISAKHTGYSFFILCLIFLLLIWMS